MNALTINLTAALEVADQIVADRVYQTERRRQASVLRAQRPADRRINSRARQTPLGDLDATVRRPVVRDHQLPAQRALLGSDGGELPDQEARLVAARDDDADVHGVLDRVPDDTTVVRLL